MPQLTILDELTHEVAAHGYTVAAFGGDVSGIDWAHSIGLHATYDHAELIIVGVDADIGAAMIHMLVRQIHNGRQFAPGDHVVINGGHNLHFEPVGSLWRSMGDWFAIGREVLSESALRWPTTLQVVWENAAGERPHVPGDPKWQFQQPLLHGSQTAGS